MTMFKRVKFFIEDNEFNDTYEYIGYFETSAEMLTFINENRRDGNRIFILEFIGYWFGTEEDAYANWRE